jgi:hypothetical protein
MKKKFTVELPYAASGSEKESGAAFILPPALVAAGEIFSKNKSQFICPFGESSLADLKERFEADPDIHRFLEILKKNKNKIGVETWFWICVGVLSEWEVLPKLTYTQHRELYQSIAKTAQKLCELIEKTESDYVRRGGYGLQRTCVVDLMTDSERLGLREALKEADAEGEDPQLRIEYLLPTVETLISRIAIAAMRLDLSGPVHSQPAKRGARRGFFIRRLARLSESQGQEATPEMLAILASVALDEPTDRELVLKILKN